MKLRGEYPCKLDAKGRMVLPAALKRKIESNTPDAFIINRGLGKHLALHTTEMWENKSAEVDALNPYIKDNQDFTRYFYRGATDVELDASSRILIPKTLMEYAGIKTDVVIFAYNTTIEIWSQENFDAMMASEPLDIAAFSEKVMTK